METEGADVLWGRLSAPIRAFVRRRAPNGVDADDLLQEVFLRIHTNLPRLREAERVDAWIFQIARNVLADSMRFEQRDGKHLDRSAEIDQLSLVEPEDDRERRALAQCLRGLVARLPAHSKEAIERTELGGLTQVAAASELGITVPAMKARSLRARAQLASMLRACCEIELDRRGRVLEVDGCTSESDGCVSGCGAEERRS